MCMSVCFCGAKSGNCVKGGAGERARASADATTARLQADLWGRKIATNDAAPPSRSAAAGRTSPSADDGLGETVGAATVGPRPAAAQELPGTGVVLHHHSARVAATPAGIGAQLLRVV